jgi:hypothetical protein
MNGEWTRTQGVTAWSAAARRGRGGRHAKLGRLWLLPLQIVSLFLNSRANMQTKVHSRRLFAACVVSIGVSAVAASFAGAGTPDTDPSKEFGRSAFSTTSIASDLKNNKQLRSPKITSVPNGGTLVSSKSGAFQYDSETRQTTSAHKLSEEIRATQQLENQRNAEITEHPFWNAPFWTHSPLAIAGFLLGGDHHALETPPTEFEKLGASNYGNAAEVRKYERSVSFGGVNQGNGK